MYRLSKKSVKEGAIMESTVNKNILIKMAVSCILPICIALLPTGEVFTYEMKMGIALTLFLLLWSAFEVTNLVIPSIFYAMGLIFFNVVPINIVFSAYLSTTIYGMVGGFILAKILTRVGLMKRLAYWVAIKCGGSFNRCCYAVFFAGFAVAIATFATCCLVTAAIAFGFVTAMGWEKKKEGAMIMMAGMLGASTVRMFLYYPITMACMMGSVHTVNPDFTITFPQLFVHNWPVFFYCIGFIALMQFVLKTKNSEENGSVEYFKEQYNELGPISVAEKKSIVVLALLLLWIVTNPIHGVDTMMAFALMPLVLCMPGIDVGNSEDLESVPWGTILFFASCLAIGSVFNTVGITAIIGQYATPILSSFGVVGTLVAVLIFGFVANFAMTPAAMLAAFSGLLYTISLQLGIDPLSLLYTFNMSTDMVLFPYEYLTFLVFYAFGGMSMKQFVGYHGAKCATYVVFFVAIMIPYWFLIGLV